MNININSFNNISFCKSLRANCSIVVQDDIVPCSIFQLDETDSEYFEKLMFRKDWEMSKYIVKADTGAKEIPDKDVFVLEDDEKKKCLGFCVVENDGKSKNLKYLETMPRFAFKNNRRKTKYIGEALIAFLMKTSGLGNDFHINYVLKDAIPFYENCGFKYTGENGSAIIVNEEQRENIVSQYENHIGSILSVVS